MASPSISIPNVDPKIVQKLQQVVTSIDTATGKLNTGSTGIATTKTSVNGAVTSIASNSSGQMVTALSTTIWPGTSKDGGKAHDALTSLVPHLTTLKGTINDHLPAIQTGLSAIQTAQTAQAKSTTIDQNTANTLQGQINGLITALALIASAAGTSNTGIGGLSIGGACSTGLQPGGKMPIYDDNTAFMVSGKSLGKNTLNGLKTGGRGLKTAGETTLDGLKAGGSGAAKIMKSASKYIKANTRVALLVGTANSTPYAVSDVIHGKNPLADGKFWQLYMANLAQGYVAAPVLKSAKSLLTILKLPLTEANTAIAQSFIGSGLVGNGVVATPWLIKELKQAWHAVTG
jgi:hypothetical protein